MPVSAEQSSSSTTIGQHFRHQQPRNLRPPYPSADESLIPNPSRVCKSAMSSFFLLPNGFPQTGSSSFLGLGCTASQQVSVPAVIRSSADWDATNFKSKKTKKKKNKVSYNGGSVQILSEVDRTGCVAVPDVWCGPGVGFSTDAVVGGSIDPVELDPPRRNIPVRRKIDGDKTNNSSSSNHNSNHREGSSVLPRRSQNQESNHYFDADSASRAEQTLLSDRYHRHLRHPYHDGLAETMMMQTGFVMGGTLSSHDHFRDLRLNVDNMTYEQLLELGDKIGYVNTGLTEKQIKTCLRKVKPFLSNTPLADRKCCICQEEYKATDNVGKLRCEHRFHIDCVKQWLVRKNTCPVCKRMPCIKS